MTTITITFDSDVLTQNNLSLSNVEDMAYLRSLIFNVNASIGDLHVKIMDEMVKEHDGNLFAAECIKYYRRDVKVLQDMKPSLSVKVS